MGITIVIALNGNVFVMVAVVWPPAIVTTVANVSLWSTAPQIVKPDPSCSTEIFVAQVLSK